MESVQSMLGNVRVDRLLSLMECVHTILNLIIKVVVTYSACARLDQEKKKMSLEQMIYLFTTLLFTKAQGLLIKSNIVHSIDLRLVLLKVKDFVKSLKVLRVLKVLAEG